MHNEINDYNSVVLKYKLKKWSLSFLFVLLAILISSFIINRFISPVVKKSIESRVNYIVTNEVNKIIVDTITKENITYDKLVIVDKKLDNTISGLYSNMPLVNILKSNLAISANNTLNDIDIQKLTIPLGSLFGNEFFSARGPNVTFKIMLAAMTSVEISSDFTSVGINQTSHVINADIKVGVSIILKGYKSNIEVNTRVPIAQTIIVGDVPSYYANGQGTGQIIPIEN